MTLIQSFKVLENHAPIKKRKVRGNQKPFMTRELSKAIMNKSKTKNRYTKWKSRENYLAYKKARNVCNSLNRKVKRDYFRDASAKGIMSNKTFWNTVKPFMSSKGFFTESTINIEQENGKLETDQTTLAESFNNYYINIVESSSGKKPTEIGDSSNASKDQETVKEILKNYKNHPSVLKISNEFQNIKESKFSIKKATVKDINSIIKSLDIKKATGPDGIPPKLVKLSADIIDYHLAYIINKDIEKSAFSEDAKIACVRPVFKKDERTKISNYRPVSILNVFSKIYEKYLHEDLTNHVNKIFSSFVSAYRKQYSTNHVLIRLIEEWKKWLDNKNHVGSVLMDLSKAFDCIPHDLLIAKLEAYGFSINSLTFFYSYLKRRKQNVKINNSFSSYKVLLSGVPQGSILGPVLFNVFINDLFFEIDGATLHNFADDNTISAKNSNIETLLKVLEKNSNIAIEWFLRNEMIVNPEKFQAIIIKRDNHIDQEYILHLKNQKALILTAN